MLTVEQNMLQAALVSWVVTHVMDVLLASWLAVIKTTWGKTMEHVTLVIKLAESPVVNTICSSVIVVGVCLEWLSHVARAVGIGINLRHCKRNTPAGLIPYGQPLRHFHLMALSRTAVLHRMNAGGKFYALAGFKVGGLTAVKMVKYTEK